MIRSARPTVPPVAITINHLNFVLFSEVLNSEDGRTDTTCKNSDHYRRVDQCSIKLFFSTFFSTVCTFRLWQCYWRFLLYFFLDTLTKSEEDGREAKDKDMAAKIIKLWHKTQTKWTTFFKKCANETCYLPMNIYSIYITRHTISHIPAK